MYAPGDATVTFTNVTFNIADSATSFMPTNGDNCGNPDGVPFPSQSTYTYKPSSFEAGNVLGSYPGFSSINRSGPCFQTTLNTLNEVFDGITAAGEWDLYVDNNGIADVSITSWSLILTTANAASTTTTLSSSINPSFTVSPNNSTTLTADVTSGVNAGTVAFSDGGTTISGCGALAVNSSGIATCTATFTTQGFHSLSAAYSGTSSFAPSTGTLNQFVEFHPTVSGTQFCNTGAIGIPNTGNASGTDTQPYPSVMNVSGISQSVSTVQLVLNGLTTSEILDLSMLLVSPDGNHALDFFDFVGGGVASSSTSVTFSDTASGLAPDGVRRIGIRNPQLSANFVPQFALFPGSACPGSSGSGELRKRRDGWRNRREDIPRGLQRRHGGRALEPLRLRPRESEYHDHLRRLVSYNYAGRRTVYHDDRVRFTERSGPERSGHWGCGHRYRRGEKWSYAGYHGIGIVHGKRQAGGRWSRRCGQCGDQRTHSGSGELHYQFAN